MRRSEVDRRQRSGSNTTAWQNPAFTTIFKSLIQSSRVYIYRFRPKGQEGYWVNCMYTGKTSKITSS